ncbi:MAG: gamma-glutamyltransferase [Massilia sp.]|nr:gamma-glutamyltransferase [Massilia sp.]
MPKQSSTPASRTVRMLRTLTLSIVIIVPAALAKTPVATGTGGAVATISEQASQSAMTILNRGGNAIDAAVAAAATLGVTDPFSCGIGGGGFMVIYLAGQQRVVTIDSRETAPAAVSPTMFMQNGKPIDFDTAVASGAAVGVPGTVRGWHEALSRYGSMSFKQVLTPAIGVAKQGFKASETFNRLTAENEIKFRHFSGSSALYLSGGKALPVGTVIRNPGMARAYAEIAAKGAAAFYGGPMAQAMVDAVQRPPMADGFKGAGVRGGQMTLADLANYEARIRQPVRSRYRGYELYGMSEPSSGGVVVAEALNILEGYDLKSMARPQVEHVYMEASRLAFADRNAYLADPEYVDAPVAGLLDKNYAAQRRALIDVRKAGPLATAGDPYAFQNDLSVPLRPPVSRPSRQESAHTTHFTVSDKDGNIVSYTFTIESWGGSGIVVPGYGFLLNNEMTDFDFSGPQPNVPEAGKRPRSSMAPTIALKDGKPAFTIGSPGGATIITTVLQTIVNHLDLGMPMNQAIDAPRISERNGAASSVEPGFAGSAQGRALAAMGHKWESNAEEIGAANALVFNTDGTVTAVSEGHRHGGGAAMVQRAAH